jgi:molecular chaperone DnaJ
MGGFGGFRDIFEQIFGGRGAGFGGGFGDDLFGFGFGGGRRRGRDIIYDMDLTLEDVLKGRKEEVEVPRLSKCDVCQGTGAAPGTKARKCTVCDGQGQTRRVYSQNRFSTFVTMEPCRTCQGRGQIIERPCSNCKGVGRARQIKKVKLEIPPGIEDGMAFQLRGEGEMSEQGIPGDLVVRLHVNADPKFERLEDGHLLYNLDVKFTELALGVDLRVPTIEGSEKLKIPQGTPANSILRLKGKGLPRYNRSGRGDQLVRVNVKVPNKLNDRQKSLLKELDKELDNI